MASRPLRAMAYLWASPTTVLALAVGLSCCVVGSKMRRRDGVAEFHSGLILWLFQRLPNSPAAMTLGHVVMGRNEEELDRTHAHEMIHVRQYERWGPFFLPAYFVCSAYMWFKGKNPYFDNPFEVEAYNNS